MVKKTAVAHYVPTFLKMEHTHVYRELTGLRNDFEMHVFTHQRENELYYPYHDKWLHLLAQPLSHTWRERLHQRWLKRPWQLYRSELRRWYLDLTRIEARLLHFHFGHTALPFLELMKAWPHPVLVTVHGSDLALYQSQQTSRATFHQVFQHAALILCRSESLAQDLIDLGVPKEKVKVQSTGIPLDDWPYIERSTPENGTWQLVQSCPLLEKKSIDTTLRAFAIVNQTFPNAKLLLIGEGPLRAKLEALVEELGLCQNVQFTGFRAFGSLRKHLTESHLFLHPSRIASNGDKEGIPTAILEAMATGLPIVATNHSGIAEAVSHGKSGILVNENDHNALAGAITSLLQSKEQRLKMGQAARLAIEEGFSQAQQSQLLAKLYRDVSSLGANKSWIDA